MPQRKKDGIVEILVRQGEGEQLTTAKIKKEDQGRPTYIQCVYKV